MAETLLSPFSFLGRFLTFLMISNPRKDDYLWICGHNVAFIILMRIKILTIQVNGRNIEIEPYPFKQSLTYYTLPLRI